MRLFIYFIFFLATFLLILGPVFNSVGSWADGIFFVSLIFCFLGLFKKNFFPKKFRSILILIPLSLYIIITNSLFGNEIGKDLFSFLFKPLRIIITAVGCYHFVLIAQKKFGEKTRRVLLEMMFWSIVLHGCIMIAQILDPEFKDWIYSFTTTGKFRSTFEHNFRMGGLSGSTGGAILSAVQSVGILILPFIWSKSLFKNVLFIIGSCVMFFSVIICGRTGLWGFILFLPITLYLVSINKKSFFIRMGILSIIVTIAIASIVNWLIEFQGGDSTANYIYYALSRNFDSFVNAKENKEIQDETVGALADMVILPSDFTVIFLGNPYYLAEGNNENYRAVDSDIGYVRNLWGYGIIGTIIFLFPHLYIGRIAQKKMKQDKTAALLFVLFLEISFFHSKEQFMYVRMYFSIICIIFFLVTYDKFFQKKTENNNF